jgi:hypothetical protein
MTHANPVTPLVVNEKIAAQSLGVSVGFLRADRLRDSPRIPVVRIGRSCRYSLERCREVLTAIEQGGVPAAKA